MKQRAFVLSLAAAVLAAPAFAAEPRPFTIDTMWTVKRVGVPLVSPDGTQVVYSLGTYDADENRILADLWMVPLAGGAPHRLTANKASDGHPAFSPDGSRLVFVSKREADKAAQLYLLPLQGGEPERLTDLPMDVATPRFLPDGKRIVFASHVIAGAESPEETKKALEAREKNKVKARVTENRLFRFWDRWLTDDEFPHLFVLDLETRKVTDLLPGSKRLFGLQSGEATYDVSPDGATLAFEANASEAPYTVLNTDVFVVPTAGGPVRNLTESNPAQDSAPVWSPDGKTIAYGREQKAEGYPDQARLATIDFASGRSTVLTQALDASAGGWQWAADGSQIAFVAEVRGRASLYAVAAAGGAAREVHRGGTVAGLAVTRDGQVVFQRHELNRPPEIAAVKLDGSGLRYVTTTNDGLMADTAIGPVEELTFKGADDDDVQMFVVYPPGFDEKKKYPLVQLVHGGPVGTFGDAFSFRWNPHAFAAPGVRGGDGELPRLVQLRPGLGRLHPGRAPGQAVHGRDEGDRLPDRAGLRRPRAHGGRRRLVRWVPGELDRGPHRSLQGAGQPRGCLQPARTVGVRLVLRAPLVLRRLPVHEPGPDRALDAQPLRRQLQDADAGAPRRAGLPRAGGPGPGALRRAADEGRARAARLLSRREPLGPEGPELEALVRRSARLARALAEIARDDRGSATTAATSATKAQRTQRTAQRQALRRSLCSSCLCGGR